MFHGICWSISRGVCLNQIRVGVLHNWWIHHWHSMVSFLSNYSQSTFIMGRGKGLKKLMYCFLWARCNQVILSMCIRWPCQLKNITLTDSTSITINLINKPRYMHTFYWANWWCICSIKHVCCFQLKTNHKPFEWLMVI
jgi:hypothetical protein